jgi:peptidoglycan hydrolase-like protein with peptidoglycan-binding domain
MSRPRATRMVDVGSSGGLVKKLQRRLKRLGYQPGAVDGHYGPQTGRAVQQFKRDQKMSKTHTLVNSATWRKLGFRWKPGREPGALYGTPKQIIDRLVRESQRFGFPHMTPAYTLEANNRHGPTVSGNRSDHQGPPGEAWAADISNGSNPTPEMDRFAQYLARKLGGRWGGSGAVSWYKDGYRMQLIYRSDVGGNHWNHIHIGIRKL